MRKWFSMNRLPFAGLFAVLLSLFFLPVHAADFSTVTGAFDTAGITTGIMAIGALMMAVVAVVWGLRKILGFGR